jgi:rod shape-determining protein MreD
MNIITYFFYLVLIAGFQVIGDPLTTFWGVSINLPVLIVLSLAWTKSELTATWFGFWAGLVMSAGTPQIMGWQALIMAILGWGTFHARERLNVDSLAARLSAMFAGILLHNALTLLVTQSEAFFYQLWRTALAGAVYTSLLAYLYFRFRETTPSGRRVKTRA